LYRIGLKKSSFNRLNEAYVINEKYIPEYRKFIKTNTWKSFEKKYEKFYAAYEEEFNKEVTMMVFSYNELGEEERTMSPVDSVKYHMKHLQTGMMSVDPQTGHIKAWVGGIGHKYFKYDHVNARRQVGSTFKPFVYATAIAMQGISPCQEFEDIQYSISPGDSGFDLDAEWAPSNANGKFTGNRYNLYQGLLYSKNSITVRLVKELGNIEVVRDLVENMGIDKSLIPPSPSISLGAADLSVREMAGAYTTFPNDGIYTEPIFISHIEDKNGKVIFRNSPTRRIAINPSYNRVMVDMLKNNVLGRFAIAGIKSDVGGKTGTTNDYSDGWFMGITPNLVTATWVGGDEKFIRFYTLEDGQGFVMARPIFEKYLLKVEADSTLNFDSSMKFKLPEGQYRSLVDCNRYKQIKPEEEKSKADQRNSRKDEFEEEGEEEFEEEGI
jgi:penicillin-binding protein 1A